LAWRANESLPCLVFHLVEEEERRVFGRIENFEALSLLEVPESS
jgi:hypothetical protein